jgi:hypothetical protein
MMRYFAIATAIVLAPVSASASADARYGLHGTSHVRTTKAPIAVDKIYPTDMRARITGDEESRVELSGDGMNCALRGKRVGDNIGLTPGQKCTQHVDRDGARGDLLGTLVRGSVALTPNGSAIAVSSVWSFEGKVLVLFGHSVVMWTFVSNLMGKKS